MFLKIFALLSIILMVQGGQYTLALHPGQRGASCLDGSPAGLYYHEGQGANKNKFMIYFDSGGFCQGFTIAETLESCYKRSFGSLGSTKNCKPTRSFDGQGLLSTSPLDNPVFYDWTKIYVIYCDGSQHSGTRDDPILYKDRQLYFRGYNNTMEQFYFLDKRFDFYNSQTIVITGVSAGGIATYLYANYLSQQSKRAKVYAIPDSGYFSTDYESPIVGMKVLKILASNLFKVIQVDQGRGFPIKQCLDDFPEDLYQCYNAVNLVKYIKVPLFIVESPYDQFSLDVILVVKCLTKKNPSSIATCNQTERQAIEDYRKQTISDLYIMRGDRKDVGVWAPSCVQHGYTDMRSFTDSRYKIPSVNGPMVSEAIQQFLNNPHEAPWYVDQVPWPYNKACSGQDMLQRQ